LRCQDCGYDLTGLNVTRSCPECGVAIRHSVARTGAPWQHRSQDGFLASYWRSMMDPIIRPTHFGRQLQLWPASADHATFLMLNLITIGFVSVAGARVVLGVLEESVGGEEIVGVMLFLAVCTFLVVALTRTAAGAALAMNLAFVAIPTWGALVVLVRSEEPLGREAIIGAALVAAAAAVLSITLTLTASTLMALAYKPPGPNPWSGSVQAACYLSGYLIWWMEGNWLLAAISAIAIKFEPLGSLMGGISIVALNILGLLFYLVLLNQIVRAMKFDYY